MFVVARNLGGQLTHSFRWKKERKKTASSVPQPTRIAFVGNLQTAKQYPTLMTLHSLSNWPLRMEYILSDLCWHHLILLLMYLSAFLQRISSLSNKSSCLVLVPDTLFCMRLKSQISRKEILDLNLERVRWMEGQDQLQTNPQKERDLVSPVWKVTLVWPLGNLPLATICL